MIGVTRQYHIEVTEKILGFIFTFIYKIIKVDFTDIFNKFTPLVYLCQRASRHREKSSLVTGRKNFPLPFRVLSAVLRI